MAERVDKHEVTVIDERIVTTYPAVDKPAYTAIVTYKYTDPVPRTLFLPLSDVAKGREAELNKQINDKKGDLYKAYLQYRSKKIKEDLEGVGAFKPEVVKF